MIKLVWALVAVVVLVALIRIISVTTHHRSADQRILIEKQNK